MYKDKLKKHFLRSRLVILAVLILFTIGLLVIHHFYPFTYIYRVLVYQNSDFSDIHRFPARSIAASKSPLELPIVPDTHAIGVVEQYPGSQDLGLFLEKTETTAFLILHEGQLVVEQYLRNHDRNTFQNTFSVSKSITSALVGLALRDGILELDSPITRFLPDLGARDERFAKITIEHLLDMRSGIEYSHDTPFPFVNADDPLIYYHPDLESIILKRTAVASPPGAFKYNNYNPPLIGLILRRATGLSAAEYLERELWGPLRANYGAGWTVDDHGFERMESGFHARARDLARFGLLYLNRGQEAGRQILPEYWVLESTNPSAPLEIVQHDNRTKPDQYNGRSWGYRLGWWIIPRPDGPPDFSAIGRYGQFIYVSPQYNAVFVRNGPGRGDWGDFKWTEFFYFVAERL